MDWKKALVSVAKYGILVRKKFAPCIFSRDGFSIFSREFFYLLLKIFSLAACVLLDFSLEDEAEVQ